VENPYLHLELIIQVCVMSVIKKGSIFINGRKITQNSKSGVENIIGGIIIKLSKREVIIMTREIVGNRMIIKCPYCKSEISILLNSFNKKGVKEKIFKCPICNKEM